MNEEDAPFTGMSTAAHIGGCMRERIARQYVEFSSLCRCPLFGIAAALHAVAHASSLPPDTKEN